MTHKPEKSPHELTESEMLDPHGNVKHEHVILSVPLLLSVLIALLILTVLTVAASKAETAIADALNIVIPQWINVMVAMSFAVVKATIVALFFMQLKYDNKLNAVVIVVSIGCVGLFLGLTAIDLDTRGIINPVEQHNIQAGGKWTTENPLTTGKPITEVAKLNYIDKHGGAKWEEEMALSHGEHHEDPSAHWSSAQQSRQQHGPTGLFEGGSEH